MVQLLNKIINSANHRFKRYSLVIGYLITKIFLKKIKIVSGISFICRNVEEYSRAVNLLIKEPFTIKWIDENFKGDDVFYDIGANIGVFSLYAANRVKKVLAFEPHFLNYQSINENILINKLDNRVLAYCICFTDNNDVGELSLYKYTHGSSTSQFNRKHAYEDTQFNSKFIQGILSLTVDCFGNICSPELFPNHIKIDVDGLEPQIIEGMQSVLSDARLKSVLVELSQTNTDTLRYMESIGFSIRYQELANKNDPDGPQNYVFVRNTL